MRHLFFRYLPLPCWALAVTATAQTVPSDLLDLSLEQLVNARLREAPSRVPEGASPWSLRYSVTMSSYEEYFDGNSSRSYDEVLWTPATEARAADNYPVVPTEISQRVHAFSLSYRHDEHWSATLLLPYVEQSTDHISIVPGYDNFIIDSDGIGDIGILPAYSWTAAGGSRWQASLGMTLPTGSIDKEGDTPRAAGEQQLPYTMQIGSGTYDLVAALSTESRRRATAFGARLSGKVRLDENDRGYTLGDNVSGTAWVGYEGWSGLQPTLALTYWWRGDISGEDPALRIPGAPFPYPAPVVDPARFGGQQLELAAGFTLPLRGTGATLEAEYRLPLWRDLNGPQSGLDYSFRLGVQYDF